MSVSQSASTAQSTSSGVFVVAGIVAAAMVVVGVAVARVLSVRRKLHHAGRAGRDVSAATQTVSASANEHPLTTFNREGHAGDPLNMQVVGSNGQLGASFAAAGWYRADEIDFVTSTRISVDSVMGRAYSTAPVSNLYLFGRKEDYAFERPGPNVRERDHIRFWNTGQVGPDGRAIWIGSATKDVKVELSHTNHLPTHGISPDLDAERALVLSELAQSGYVVTEGERPGFGKETRGENGGGDPYYTDGQVAILTLANVWTHPLATQVRGPLGARIAQALERALRWRLPKEGLTRAESEFARLAQRIEHRPPPAAASVEAPVAAPVTTPRRAE
jgi:LssY C-terminus